MNKIAGFLEHALKKGELRKYLTGSNEYNIAKRRFIKKLQRTLGVWSTIRKRSLPICSKYWQVN